MCKYVDQCIYFFVTKRQENRVRKSRKKISKWLARYETYLIVKKIIKRLVRVSFSTVRALRFPPEN